MSEKSTHKFLLLLGLFLIIVGWFVFPTDTAQTTSARSATMSDYTDIDVAEDIELTQLYQDSYAVVIGINEYADNSFRSLHGEDDALAIEELLLDKGYQVKTFLSEEATLDAIRVYLMEELPAMLSPNDRLLIYFAGHGVTIGGEQESRKQGYLAVYDTQRTENGAVDINTAFPMIEMSALLSQYSAKHKLLIADSCFSGLFMLQSRSTKRDPTINMLQVMVEEPFVGMLTAGREGDEAFEMNDHGVFTWHVLQGLKGEADRDQDGVITATDLQSYVQSRVIMDVHELSNGQQSQNPQYQSRGEGEYVFLHTDLKSTLPMKFGSASDAEQYSLSRSVQQLINYAETVGVDVSVPQKPFTKESVQQFQQAVFQRWENVYGEQPHDVVLSLSVGEDATIEEDRVSKDSSGTPLDGSLNEVDTCYESSINSLTLPLSSSGEETLKAIEGKVADARDSAKVSNNDLVRSNCYASMVHINVIQGLAWYKKGMHAESGSWTQKGHFTAAAGNFSKAAQNSGLVFDMYFETKEQQYQFVWDNIKPSYERIASAYSAEGYDISRATYSSVKNAYNELKASIYSESTEEHFLQSDSLSLGSETEGNSDLIQVGKALPTFAGNTLDETYVSFQSLVGPEKTVVVSYFTTDCDTCADGLSRINQYAMHNENLEVIYIALGERDVQSIRQWLEPLQLTHPVVIDKFETIGSRHGVVVEGQDSNIPTTFILNSDGIVQSVYKGIYPDFTDPSVLGKTGTFQ